MKDTINLLLVSRSYSNPSQNDAKSKSSDLLHTLLLCISTSIWELGTPKPGCNLLFTCFCTYLQDFDAKLIKN